jgi:SH3/ankyrin repeat-containing protein
MKLFKRKLKTFKGFCENQSQTTMPPPSSVTISTATIHQQHSAAPTPQNMSSTAKSGSSSPTSRSRSISSDDHGFGSASLSQMSGSPNIEYAYPRKRLYPSIPNRTFVCIRAFKPTQPGEIELKKGDIVELLSIGDSGFWEGRSNSNEGWFKANCVEEFTFPKDTTQQTDSVVVKRKTLFDLITQNELNVPRTVVLQRGKKGFGFVLRGAKSNSKLNFK